MTRRLFLVPITAAMLALAGCATAVPPVSVTRFHTPAVTNLVPGTAYRVAETADGGLEATSYRLAVENELRELGFVATAAGGSAPLVVRVAVERQDRLADGPSPVSVGVGGGTGGYGSGVGVGIGFNLGGGPRRPPRRRGRSHRWPQAKWPRRCSGAFRAHRERLSLSPDPRRIRATDRQQA
jgi:hypothetical protein